MCRVVELRIGPSWYWGKAMNLALLDDDIQTGLFYLVCCLLEKKQQNNIVSKNGNGPYLKRKIIGPNEGWYKIQSIMYHDLIFKANKAKISEKKKFGSHALLHYIRTHKMHIHKRLNIVFITAIFGNWFMTYVTSLISTTEYLSFFEHGSCAICSVITIAQ